MADNDLVINIVGDNEEFNQSLNDSSQSAKSFEQNLASIAKISGVAFAGLTAGIVGSIAAFREQEQAELQLNAALESTQGIAGLTAKELTSMASALQSVTTIGDETIISGQALLLTFTNIRKDAFEPAIKVSADLATRLGTDKNSAVLLVGKALNAPTQNLGALTRAGIQFSDEQRDVIKNLTETGRVAEAQALILKELETQFGGSAEAAAQGTGSFIQLRNALSDVAEQIGAVFAPAIIIISQRLVRLVEFVKQNEQAVKAFAIAIGVGAAGTGLLFGITTIGLLLPSLISGLNLLKFAFIGNTTAVRGLVGATGLGALLIVIPLVIQNFDEIVNFTTGPFFAAFTFISEVIDGVVAKFLGLGRAVIAVTQGDFSAAVDAAKEALTPLPVIVFRAGREAAKSFTDGRKIGQQLEQERIKNEEAQQTQAFDKQLENIGDFQATEQQITAENNQVIEGIQKDKLDTLVDIEQDLGDQLIEIDTNTGIGQIDVFDRTTEQLVSAAQERGRRIQDAAQAEGRGVSSRDTGGGETRTLTGAEGSTFDRILRGELKGKIRGGGSFGQASASDILLGQTVGGLNRTGAAGAASGGTRIEIDLKPQAAKFITTKTNENQRLGVDRSIS